jgi:hypothetical protein
VLGAFHDVHPYFALIPSQAIQYLGNLEPLVELAELALPHHVKARADFLQLQRWVFGQDRPATEQQLLVVAYGVLQV